MPVTWRNSSVIKTRCLVPLQNRKWAFYSPPQMSREQEQPVEQERKACSCAHFAGSNVELGFFFFFYARGLVELALVGWGAVRLLRSLMVWFFLPQMEAFLFLFFCCAQEIPASQAPFNRTRIHWQHEAPRSLSHEPPTAPLKKDPGNNSMINVGKTAKWHIQ